MRQRSDGFELEDEPLWYKDAIIYEVHPRAFYDSDGDGIGDFQGLTEKLDYLKDLGVTAVWLLPFYPSPLRDDGYDISDYTNVHPAYGTLRDFNTFLREAHRRGLRVITELVLNHTSDQHPWFQRARRANPGTAWRDFYVWSDTPERYREARIIFKDFEASNWDWDPVARAYYWHRFYRHQPDLNYDSPHVRRAMFRVMDFWLKLGVDGMRLDAVPYLYEREGTNCENLYETHLFLKELREHIDQNFRNRMLLAEANQWPEDAVAYFGEGDECHMAFHFPVMPRLFMAIRMEDRFPVVEILQQTPAIPDTCQWALFLRNHDELTLEMVTDEERDYMYRTYAHDPHMRINLGIRRRLAPLLGNDRRKIELMNGLLFSLPGTPVVYYGDEIGMGDNFFLGDRNGVRTPMQWSANRNAGFSKANPQRLYLPVIIDPEYHYEALNVENEQNNPNSLLWWMKRIIALRKRYKAFGRGTLEFLYPENHKVLAFLRRYQDERILVVANLSRFSEYVMLDLSAFKGMVPVELFGGRRFPPIGDLPYLLTLGPYAFYWFSLEPLLAETGAPQVSPAQDMVPVITVKGDWEDLFSRELRDVLGSVLLRYIRGRRWFGGKARPLQSAELQEAIAVPMDSTAAYLALVKVEYAEGEPETYLMPLAFAAGEKAVQVAESHPQAVVVRLRWAVGHEPSEGVLYDALVDKEFANTLLEAIVRHRHFKGTLGEVVASPTKALRSIFRAREGPLEPTVMRVEQSNTSIAYGNRLILKLFRRPDTGVNPDLEIGHFLTEKVAFPHIPPVGGLLEYRRKESEPRTLAILQAYVPNEGDAWRYTLDDLGRYFEGVLAHPEAEAPAFPQKHWLALVQEEIPTLARELIGPYLESARLLGQRTGELHLALSSAPEDPAFAPEPFSDLTRRALYHGMIAQTDSTFQFLRQRVGKLSGPLREQMEKLLALEAQVRARFRTIRDQKVSGMRIRVHGDYHLGQVLYAGKDFVIIDFEGEPARPLSERRIKRSPTRDVASMLRSFHYAAYAALFGQVPGVLPQDFSVLEPWARFWYHWVSVAFLKGYLAAVDQSPILPKSVSELQTLLEANLLEKALYELSYELNNRPDWVRIPLEGILQLLQNPG